VWKTGDTKKRKEKQSKEKKRKRARRVGQRTNHHQSNVRYFPECARSLATLRYATLADSRNNRILPQHPAQPPTGERANTPPQADLRLMTSQPRPSGILVFLRCERVERSSAGRDGLVCDGARGGRGGRDGDGG
jgi:hypothetical protein